MSQPAEQPPARLPSDLLGTRVGRYRLSQRIGEGGMGVVYLGLDEHQRAVAVKVLRPHVAGDPDARRRLAREVTTLQRVRHERIAQVLDADVDGPVPFVVTEYVPAVSLDAQVREHGPLAAERLLRLGFGLGDALGAIHGAGVIHRDLKPANVMMREGDPVVIDFGIAHVADDSRLTMTGLVMGTPGYLSPELIEGGSVDRATDWWGWAATMAFAATARPPFGRGPMEVVLDRVRRGDADLDGVPTALVDVLRPALSPDPAARPRPGELRAALSAARESLHQAPTMAVATSDAPTQVVPATVLNWAPATQVAAVPATQVAAVPASHVAARGQTQVAARAQAPAATANLPVGRAQPVIDPHRSFAHDAVARHAPPPYQPYANPPQQVATRTAAPAGPAEPAYRGVTTSQPPGAPQQRGEMAHYDRRPPAQPPGVDQPGPAAPRPARSGTMMAALLLLMAGFLTAPLVSMAAFVGVSALARTADRISWSVLKRRHGRGPRASDVAYGIAQSPLQLIAGSLLAGLSALLPILLAICAFFAVAAFLPADGSGWSELAAPAAAALVYGYAHWWGLGGASLRRGSRQLARTFTPGRPGAVFAVCLLAILAVAVLTIRWQTGAPNWYPLQVDPLTQIVGVTPSDLLYRNR